MKKPILQSKINGTGIGLVVLGAIQVADFSSVATPEIAGSITAAAGFLVFIFRTWFTNDQ